jgi:hypothetical protein
MATTIPRFRPTQTKNSVKTVLDNIVEDPFAMGWDAGDDMDDPLPCPFKEPMAAKLWRQGYTARVNDYIAKKKSAGGLAASLL